MVTSDIVHHDSNNIHGSGNGHGYSGELSSIIVTSSKEKGTGGIETSRGASGYIHPAALAAIFIGGLALLIILCLCARYAILKRKKRV
jgi:hypothetical protein